MHYLLVYIGGRCDLQSQGNSYIHYNTRTQYTRATNRQADRQTTDRQHPMTKAELCNAIVTLR